MLFRSHGRVSGVPHGWFYNAGVWRMDVAGQPTITSAQLRALALAGQEVTVMGVPRGAGTRMALDRDRDGSYDGDELAAGSDPGNPVSTPSNVGVDSAPLATRLQAARPNPFRGGTHFEFSLAEPSVIEFTVFDVLGREVRHLAPRQKWPAGTHSLAWDGRREDGTTAGPGMYFARLQLADRTLVRMVVKLDR